MKILQANVTKQIGSFRSPTQFRIVGKQIDQNPLKPGFVVRFQMDATNRAALYVPDGNKIGGSLGGQLADVSPASSVTFTR